MHESCWGGRLFHGTFIVLVRLATGSVELSLLPLLTDVSATLRGLFVWPTGSVGTTVQPKPARLALENTPSMLGPIVPVGRLQNYPGAASSSSSSASTAIVPVSSPEMPNLSEAAAFALGQLFEKGARHTQVKFSDLMYVDIRVVMELQRNGLVAVTETDLMETVVLLKPEAHAIVPCYGIRAPVPVHRVASQLPLMKQTKVSVLLRLHEDGWRPAGAAVAAYKIGEPKVYKPGFTQPLSYFVVLLSCETILTDKGVPEILHGMTDNYYKCLLYLPKAKPAPLLDKKDEADAFFRGVLKKEMPKLKDDDSDSSGGDGGGEGGPLALPPMPGLMPLLGPSAMAERVPWRMTEWQRCWVTLGETRIKVWFDNCCASNALRRGWANCATHRCGKIRPVMENRDYFACAMALWHRHGAGSPDMPRHEHMQFWPEPEDVRASLPHCTFELF